MTEIRGRRSEVGGQSEIRRFQTSDFGPRTSRRLFRRAGFTLMEILVVVFIGLLCASLAAPSFAKALKSQRLRTSARSVVSAHKYARNMSVLRQQPMAVLFDRIGQVVEVVAVADRSGLAARGGFLEERSRAIRDEAAEEKKKKKLDPEEGPPPTKLETIDLRQMASEVRITDFKSEGDFFHRDGVYWVNYYPSGMSDGFTLRLEDEGKRSAVISADPISGGAEVDFDDQ